MFDIFHWFDNERIISLSHSLLKKREKKKEELVVAVINKNNAVV
jgi:hypothetical protein